jgi:hypothetical protein
MSLASCFSRVVRRRSVTRRDGSGRPAPGWFGSLFDSYRPERHYMRGPGPKCREKDGGCRADTSRTEREP